MVSPYGGAVLIDHLSQLAHNNPMALFTLVVLFLIICMGLFTGDARGSRW